MFFPQFSLEIEIKTNLQNVKLVYVLIRVLSNCINYQ